MHCTASSAHTHFGSRSSTWDTCGVYEKYVLSGTLREPAVAAFHILADARNAPSRFMADAIRGRTLRERDDDRRVKLDRGRDTTNGNGREQERGRRATAGRVATTYRRKQSFIAQSAIASRRAPPPHQLGRPNARAVGRTGGRLVVVINTRRNQRHRKLCGIRADVTDRPMTMAGGKVCIFWENWSSEKRNFHGRTRAHGGSRPFQSRGPPKSKSFFHPPLFFSQSSRLRKIRN